jgi:hypothetical protein
VAQGGRARGTGEGEPMMARGGLEGEPMMAPRGGGLDAAEGQGRLPGRGRESQGAGA